LPAKTLDQVHDKAPAQRVAAAPDVPPILLNSSDAPLCACGGAAGSDGLCGPCRLRKFRFAKQRPPLPPNVIEELRLAYVGNVREVSANLNRVAARTGIPKSRLKEEARKRGWRSQTERRPWTAAEVGIPIRKSVASVQLKARKLRRSLRVSEGYNVSDLAEVFGVPHARVEGWAKRGLMGRPTGHGGHGGNIRFATMRVLRFIKEHASEYDLGRVDQDWFKSMVFAFRASEGLGRR